MPKPVPIPVAHRGDAEHFPENTVAAIRGAVACGVGHVEIDVQLTADRVPVLMHDASLQRTAGVDRMVTASIASELTRVPLGGSERSGARFVECVPTLADALGEVAGAKLTLFVELKRHSMRAFGRRRVLDAVLPVLDATTVEVVVISFDRPVLELVRRRRAGRIGWVLDAWDRNSQDEAARLDPEFLFCNWQRLPEAGVPLWPGGWRWVVYEVADVQQARRLAERGVAFVESMSACRLYRELAE